MIATRPPPERPAEPSAEVRAVTSHDLLDGARELVIVHAGETDRLRITSKDRLILTK